MSNHKALSKGLKIIIVGCGKVGSTLINQLTHEGHDITIIDTDAAKIQEITNLYDIMGVVGNGASYNLQKEAGVDKADLIIAVTGSDELNLLCCTIARRSGKCQAIARVRTPEYSRDSAYLRDKLGLVMIINPELEAAREMARILYLPTALEVSSFVHGAAEMVKIKLTKDSPLDQMTIAQLRQHYQCNILICAIEREGKVFIPSGAFILKAGDIISYVGTRREGRLFLKKIGFMTKQVKSTMIVGGGKTAYYLADQLLRMGISVKIIESDRARCEELSILLPEAIIINGDGTNEELLKEEGIADMESFIPLSGIDEENIMLTLHAKTVSDAKVITKVNRINYAKALNQLDLGSVIYPKYITSEAIIAYVRARKASIDSNVETLYHLFDQRAEAIEFHVSVDSKVTNVPLFELKLKRDLLIAFISRNGSVFLPSGQDTIQVGDNVMIVTTNTGFNDITDILA